MDQIEKEQIIEIHDELCDLLNGLPPIIVLGAIAMFIGQMTMTRVDPSNHDAALHDFMNSIKTFAVPLTET